MSYVLWALPMAFALFWMAGRVVAYFLWTAEEGMADFVATVLPEGYHPSVAEGFWTHGVKVLYEERMSLIQAHAGVSAVWGVAAILQLLPFVRNYAGFVGYVFYLCSAVFLVQMSYILFVLGMVNVGQGMFVADVVSLVLVGVCTPLGYYYIKAGQVNKHRSMMILACAGLFSNAVQRFVWVLMSKSEVLGHATSWEAWRDGTSSMTGYVGLTLTLLVGCFYAFFTKADDAAVKHMVAKKKQQQKPNKRSNNKPKAKSAPAVVRSAKTKAN
ncbi:uncharacterized protein ACA1_046500 [Acanthamoeba castellanii str. Neff]|uniref:Transmembrane protein n=1 Tax=Acanthamoeba castellanii (strain ATCC 30010 / Neff) TaxID=1257118 RepID=L8H9R4_ACACF|nr:uncharacterized protein ACA1_046500 [Acanthamoeba castellanii str. Neff]ELR21930.1 hypothetical protein ACA1_046500 [Acanthamoeba castellanii str. Neff]